MITDPDIATILGYFLLLPPTGGWFALRFIASPILNSYMSAFYSVVNEKKRHWQNLPSPSGQNGPGRPTDELDL